MSPNAIASRATNKVASTALEAVAEITDGASVAVGGFGTSGMPMRLVDALLELGVRDLHLISNNCGMPGEGLSRLVEAGRVAKFTMSYMGQNTVVAQMYHSGGLEIEFLPQGTLAEKLRAGGAGIPAFYTPTGRGTLIEEGGLPTRFDLGGSISATSAPRATAEFDGQTYLLERSMRPDFALIRAHIADTWGNLRFRVTARNFNPIFATAAHATIVEAEQVVEPSMLDGDDIHLPGVFVNCVWGVPVDTSE